jgi:hypothetical protein
MDKYPPWLDRQTAAAASSSSCSSLSAEDLERYKAQYDCITRLVAAYEHEPDNTTKIMELLQEVRDSAAAAGRVHCCMLMLLQLCVGGLLVREIMQLQEVRSCGGRHCSWLRSAPNVTVGRMSAGLQGCLRRLGVTAACS